MLASIPPFWAVSLLMTLSPGADWAYVIASGLRGRRVMLPAVVGLVLGHALVTLLVACGLGLIVARTPWLMTVLTVAGALYLLWLGVQMLLHPALPVAGDDAQAGPWSRWLIKGTCISGLNPKVLLLLLAMLPQFIDTTLALSTTQQVLVLGAVHLVNCFGVYLPVGFASSAVLRTRPAAARWVGRISGVVMVGIAMGLLVEQLGLQWH